MDRLLYKELGGDITCRSRDFDKVFPTLYAYEETGLTPEQIHKLCEAVESLLQWTARNGVDQIMDFAEAYKEGRLIILDAPKVPVMEDPDPLSSDVFCPRCKENLSGAFGDDERILLQCPKCGQYIDGKKSMSPAEAEAWLEEE